MSRSPDCQIFLNDNIHHTGTGTDTDTDTGININSSINTTTPPTPPTPPTSYSSSSPPSLPQQYKQQQSQQIPVCELRIMLEGNDNNNNQGIGIIDIPQTLYSYSQLREKILDELDDDYLPQEFCFLVQGIPLTTKQECKKNVIVINVTTSTTSNVITINTTQHSNPYVVIRDVMRSNSTDGREQTQHELQQKQQPQQQQQQQQQQKQQQHEQEQEHNHLQVKQKQPQQQQNSQQKQQQQKQQSEQQGLLFDLQTPQQHQYEQDQQQILNSMIETSKNVERRENELDNMARVFKKKLKSVVKTSCNEIKQLTQQLNDEEEKIQKLTQQLNYEEEKAQRLTPEQQNAYGAELIRFGIDPNRSTQIDLNHKAVGDFTLQAIAHSMKLINITSLHLYGSNISDVGIKALATSTTLSNLTLLDLGLNSTITYAGLETLLKSTALPRLSLLRLTKGNITDAQAQDLMKIRPSLSISFY